MPAILMLLTCAGLAAADGAGSAPADVVDRQLAAYNAKNVDAFLRLYAPEAELFEFPDKSLARGTEALRERAVLPIGKMRRAAPFGQGARQPCRGRDIAAAPGLFYHSRALEF